MIINLSLSFSNSRIFEHLSSQNTRIFENCALCALSAHHLLAVAGDEDAALAVERGAHVAAAQVVVLNAAIAVGYQGVDASDCAGSSNPEHARCAGSVAACLQIATVSSNLGAILNEDELIVIEHIGIAHFLSLGNAHEQVASNCGRSIGLVRHSLNSLVSSLAVEQHTPTLAGM